MPYRSLLPLLLTGWLLCAGCGDTADQPAEPVPADTVPSPAIPAPAPDTSSAVSSDTTTFDGTTAPTEVERSGQGTATLTSVRTGRHEGYDRVVFGFQEAVPGYQIRYVETPVQCGSGHDVEVAGAAYLEVQMSFARAHTEAGEAIIEERERTLDLPALRALSSTCDFEGYVTWVLGLADQTPYHVNELNDPPRLVLDVAHTEE